jgi:hypothetical protein
MWFNISASSMDKDPVRNRDMIVKEMTSSQMEKAQNIARQCNRKKYKGC